MTQCNNVKECACPKTSCKNYGRCCSCVIKHRDTGSLPYCLFPDNNGDKSVKNYYRTLQQRFNILEDIKVKTMKIYEPAMCCPTGLCGVGINPELMRMSTVLDNLRKNGVNASRYNLNSAPQAFIQNAEVNKLINEKGTDVLPIIMFDDKVEITGRYPTNAEIVMYLNISPEFLEAPKKNEGGCCCGDDNKDGGCC